MSTHEALGAVNLHVWWGGTPQINPRDQGCMTSVIVQISVLSVELLNSQSTYNSISQIVGVVILFLSVVFIGLTFIHITDSRYLGFSVSIYLGEGEGYKEQTKAGLLGTKFGEIFYNTKKYCL